jgi:hypothetical protein
MEENKQIIEPEQSENNIEQCQELKNIKYKTMLLNGSILKETKSSNDLSNLDKFLDEEMKSNSNEPWCKLNKTIKTKKLLEYVKMYKVQNSLDEEETEILILFLKECLDKKKLIRVKDVTYDKTDGMVLEIPSLLYNKGSKHFTLKNMDKRISTLKSLSIKKANGTIRNKMNPIYVENETIVESICS